MKSAFHIIGIMEWTTMSPIKLLWRLYEIKAMAQFGHDPLHIATIQQGAPYISK